MKRQTFAVLFYIKKARIGKLGETPILARITLNGGKHGQTDPVRTVQIDPFKTA